MYILINQNKIHNDLETIKYSIDGNPITGLYIAREVIVGAYSVNKLGGKATTEIIIFGCQAGISDSEYSKNFEHNEVVLPVLVTKIAVPLVQGDYKDGTYKGSAVGNNGDIEL